MNELMVVACIIFLMFVAPLWLILHYRSKKQLNQGLSQQEQLQLTELAEKAEKMAQRVQNLESILDAEAPQWRQTAQRQL